MVSTSGRVMPGLTRHPPSIFQTKKMDTGSSPARRQLGPNQALHDGDGAQVRPGMTVMCQAVVRFGQVTQSKSFYNVHPVLKDGIG